MLVQPAGMSAAVNPNLVIRSANVLITISYAVAPAGPGQPPVNAPNPGAMTAVARDVLAALARVR
jgi:hypothetical protein